MVLECGSHLLIHLRVFTGVQSHSFQLPELRFHYTEMPEAAVMSLIAVCLSMRPVVIHDLSIPEHAASTGVD